MGGGGIVFDPPPGVLVEDAAGEKHDRVEIRADQVAAQLDVVASISDHSGIEGLWDAGEQFRGACSPREERDHAWSCLRVGLCVSTRGCEPGDLCHNESHTSVMKTIKDSVHDHIEVSGAALDLLDTPAVQRLRHIKQLGTVELVYPAANHTRFEHSLGVYHLACQALERLEVRGATATHVEVAALLHDIGHPPYSHNIEPLVQRHAGHAHDEVLDLLTEGELIEILDEWELEPARIAGLIAGEGRFGQLISGELDVDRMDYLVRDAHHTGVPYGTIDSGRLLRELTFIDGQLVLGAGNVQTAESLLIARALMNPTVYNHHAARISKSMLRRATEYLVITGEVDIGELRRMDDHDLHAALRRHEATRDMAFRIAYRELYKRAVWAEADAVPEFVVDATHEEIRDLEDEIAATAEVDAEKVILDVPPQPGMRETSTRVVVGDEVRRLGDQSALVDALRAAQREQWRFGVYTTGGLREPVGHAAERVLGLETEGRLVVERQGRYVPLDEFEG